MPPDTAMIVMTPRIVGWRSSVSPPSITELLSEARPAVPPVVSAPTSVTRISVNARIGAR